MLNDQCSTCLYTNHKVVHRESLFLIYRSMTRSCGLYTHMQEKCEQLHQKLKNFNKEVKALRDEKKFLERQVTLLTEEISRLIEYQVS